MKHDLEMVVHKLGRDLDYINIYPIGDLHIGSSEFSEEMWYTWKKMVMEDERGYVVIIGDMADNGLKNSKTNSYQATMRPREQKEWLKRELGDFKDKILGVIQGNHEERSVRDTDDCILYDVCAKLDIEDLYRENMEFVKVSLGEKRSDRQFTYVLVLGHGASKSKVDRFSRSIDGIDAHISGHTHQPAVNFPAKLVVDPRNDVVTQVSFVELVVPSFLKFGGYAMKSMYSPTANDRIPVLNLSGKQKRIEVIWK